MKIIFKKYIVVALLAAIFALPVNAYALTAAQLQAQRDYYAAQAEAARKKAAQKAEEAAAVKQQITNIDGQISTTTSAMNETKSSISQTQSSIDDLSAKLKIEEENLVREKSKMNTVLASWYMEEQNGLFEAMISSNNISELMTKEQYYDSIKQQIQGTVEKIDNIKAELNSQKLAQEKQMRDLSDLKANQERQKKTLENQEWVKKRLLTDTTNVISELKEEEKVALKKEAEIEAEISRIISSRRGSWGAEKGKGQRVSAGNLIGSMGSTGNSTGAHLHFEVQTASGNHTNPRNYLGSMFVWPTLSQRVTQEYGKATCTVCGYSFHTGLDIGAVSPGVSGDPIFAAAAGEIVMKQWYGGYGYAVVVLHDNDMVTLYGHLATAK